MSEEQSGKFETIFGIIGGIIVLGFLITVPVLLLLGIRSSYFSTTEGAPPAIKYLMAWVGVFGWLSGVAWAFLEWVAELSRRRWLHVTAIVVLLSGQSVAMGLAITVFFRYERRLPWFVHVLFSIFVVLCLAGIVIKLWRRNFFADSSEES
jgi:hypothetical protein